MGILFVEMPHEQPKKKSFTKKNLTTILDKSIRSMSSLIARRKTRLMDYGVLLPKLMS
jgi:hypothetical protein